MVKPTIRSNSESQDLLKVLSHCKPKIRNAILKNCVNDLVHIICDCVLKNCENDLVHIICDCVYNVVKGNGKCSRTHSRKVNKLTHHKTSLIKLTEKVPIKEKIKILVQKVVDFFHFYFPSLLPQ